MTLKNLKIISKKSSIINADTDVCGYFSGGSWREVAKTGYQGQLYFENVTVEAQSELGDATMTGSTFKRF